MLKDDIKKVKDQGKLFERLSSDYDTGRKNWLLMISFEHFEFLFFFSALQKNADASKTKRTWKDPWQRSNKTNVYLQSLTEDRIERNKYSAMQEREREDLEKNVYTFLLRLTDSKTKNNIDFLLIL